MIWHIYSNNEKLVINEQQLKIVNQDYTPSISSSEDTAMQTDEEGGGDFYSEEVEKECKQQDSNNKSMFLNFTSDLSPQEPYGSKKKKSAVNNSSLKTQQASFKVNGVNILNRKNLDSKTVIDRIQKRRENHNHVERRRRDCINNTILELSKIIPNASLPGQKLNKGNVLKLAVDHILHLQSENVLIKHQLNKQAILLESRESVQSSSIENTSSSSSSHHIHHNRIKPTIQSTTGLSTITYTENSFHHQPNKSPVAAAAALLRPLLPAVREDNKKAAMPRIAPRPQCNVVDQILPASTTTTTFIENKLYYKSTARYL